MFKSILESYYPIQSDVSGFFQVPTHPFRASVCSKLHSPLCMSDEIYEVDVNYK